MLDILIKDILPIFVIMFLGYVAGKKGIFKTEDSKVLNKLVLTYALPAALFVSIVKADSAMLFDDLKLTIISLVVITGIFLANFAKTNIFLPCTATSKICHRLCLLFVATNFCMMIQLHVMPKQKKPETIVAYM